jgi:hypothetical protein
VLLLRRQHALESETPQSEKLPLRKQLQRERDVQLLRKVVDEKQQNVAEKRKAEKRKAEKSEKLLKEEDKQLFR